MTERKFTSHKRPVGYEEASALNVQDAAESSQGILDFNNPKDRAIIKALQTTMWKEFADELLPRRQEMWQTTISTLAQKTPATINRGNITWLFQRTELDVMIDTTVQTEIWDFKYRKTEGLSQALYRFNAGYNSAKIGRTKLKNRQQMAEYVRDEQFALGVDEIYGSITAKKWPTNKPQEIVSLTIDRLNIDEDFLLEFYCKPENLDSIAETLPQAKKWYPNKDYGSQLTIASISAFLKDKVEWTFTNKKDIFEKLQILNAELLHPDIKPKTSTPNRILRNPMLDV